MICDHSPMQAMLIECVPLQAAQAMPEQPDQAAQEVLQQLEQLEQQLAGLVESIVPELQLASKQAIWAGASMFVAAAFANEEALWLALCLQVSSCHAQSVLDAMFAFDTRWQPMQAAMLLPQDKLRYQPHIQDCR